MGSERLSHLLTVRPQENSVIRILISEPWRSTQLIPIGCPLIGAVCTSMRVVKTLTRPQNSACRKPHINQRWLPRCVGTQMIRAEEVSQIVHHSPEERRGWGLSLWKHLGGYGLLSGLCAVSCIYRRGQGGSPSLLPIASTEAPGEKGLNRFGSLPHSQAPQQCLVQCGGSRNICC